MRATSLASDQRVSDCSPKLRAIHSLERNAEKISTRASMPESSRIAQPCRKRDHARQDQCTSARSLVQRGAGTLGQCTTGHDPRQRTELSLLRTVITGELQYGLRGGRPESTIGRHMQSGQRHAVIVWIAAGCSAVRPVTIGLDQHGVNGATIAFSPCLPAPVPGLCAGPIIPNLSSLRLRRSGRQRNTNE